MSEEELPKGWAWATLGQLLREPLRNGHSAKATNTSSGVPTLTLTAVTTGRFTDENIKLTTANPANVQDLWLESGDIFIERANTPELVGTAAMYSGPPRLAIFPDLLIRARLHPDIRTAYVALFLKDDSARAYFRSRAQGIAGTMPKIDQRAVEELVIPIPPRREQDRIVSAIEQHLTDIDAGVAGIERALAHLKRYRASALKAACEGRLVPTEAELARKEKRDYEPADVLLRRILKERRARWEADRLAKRHVRSQSAKRDAWDEKGNEPASDSQGLPGGWCYTRLEQLADIGTGTTPLRSNKKYYENGTVPWVTSGAVNERVVRRASEYVSDVVLQETSLKVYPAGTLIVAMYGEGKTRGKVARLGIDSTINQALAAIVFEGLAGSVRPYVEVVLEANYENFRRIASGGVQPNLNLGLVASTAIPLPPLAEQHRIVAEADRLLSTADETEQTLRAQLARAARLRQAVLKRAFEGKLVPQDPNDEPASALLARLRAQEPAEPKRAARSRPRRSARASEP